MKKILKISVMLGAIVVAISCTSDDDAPLVEQKASTENFLIFGHFYGECDGDDCIQTYKLESEKLWEADQDIYAGGNTFYVSTFAELSDAKYQDVADLEDAFPMVLFDETQTTIGCPDCADGGGLFLEYKTDTQHRYWLIDLDRSMVPEYIHPFLDLVDDKMRLINEN